MEAEDIKITFMGDCMCEAEQVAAYRNDFNEVFEGLKDFLKSSDYIVANLETPIAGEKFAPPEKYSFNAPVSFAQALRNVGVNLVSTANNHCLDRGIQGLENTLKALDGIGLEYIGTNVRGGGGSSRWTERVHKKFWLCFDWVFSKYIWDKRFS